MSTIEDGWAENKDVRLHYIDANKGMDFHLIPLFYVGGGGLAEDLLPEIPLFAPRRCISMTQRGHGKSDAPERGYAFEDYIADIEAIVERIGLAAFCIMAFSIGVPYAIEFVARHPQLVKGFIIIDYPARYPAIKPEWIETVLPKMSNRVRPHAVRAQQQESREILLWERLDKIACPVLIMRGGQSGALLTPERTAMFLQYLPNAKVVTFEKSGHMVWESDYNGFIETVKNFLQQIDTKPA